MRPVLLALLLTLATLPVQAGTLVRIGWLRGTNDITLGKARGTLERALAAQGAGVEWDGPFPASAPAVEALNADAIDITIGSSTSAVASLAAGAPVVLFAYQKLAPAAEALVVRDGGPIHTVADLAGHSVAVNRGGTGEYLLLRALETHGVDPARVRRVYLGPADAGPAFGSGAVDAMAAWDPFLTIALSQYGAHVLADGGAIGSDNAVVMIASRRFVAGQPALLRAVYDAIRADNAWATANPGPAGLVWAHELRLPDALAPALGANNAVPIIAMGPDQAAQFGRIADWYAAEHIIAARPDMAGATVDLGPGRDGGQ